MYLVQNKSKITQKPAAGEKKMGVLGPLATIPPLLFTISEQGGGNSY